MVRALACRAKGCEFESRRPRKIQGGLLASFEFYQGRDSNAGAPKGRGGAQPESRHGGMRGEGESRRPRSDFQAHYTA